MKLDGDNRRRATRNQAQAVDLRPETHLSRANIYENAGQAHEIHHGSGTGGISLGNITAQISSGSFDGIVQNNFGL